MEKRVERAFGKDYYLIGSDKDGVLYWLEQSKFDCDWYWSIGYIESFTCNEHPSKSRDIASHRHLDDLLNTTNLNWYDAMKVVFTERTLDDKQLWTFSEIMKSLYTMRAYSDLLHTGSSGLTSNPCIIIKNKEEYNRINKILIPDLLNALYNLLTFGKE
jgi:hypothetical protein